MKVKQLYVVTTQETTVDLAYSLEEATAMVKKFRAEGCPHAFATIIDLDTDMPIDIETIPMRVLQYIDGEMVEVEQWDE